MKYGRTFHLTFSNCSNDDKMLEDNSYFLNKEIVISSKLDGSNLFMSKKDVFARSHSGAPKHPSFDLAKQYHSKYGYKLWDNIHLYLEYLLAKHNIHYSNLPSYFNLFAVFNTADNTWFSWDDVEMTAKIMNTHYEEKPEEWLKTVPVLFRGIIKTEKELEILVLSLAEEKEFGVDEREGIVIRVAEEFHKDDFSKSVAKYVKKSFTDSIGDEHWKHKQIVKNKLK